MGQSVSRYRRYRGVKYSSARACPAGIIAKIKSIKRCKAADRRTVCVLISFSTGDFFLPDQACMATAIAPVGRLDFELLQSVRPSVGQWPDGLRLVGRSDRRARGEYLAETHQ